MLLHQNPFVLSFSALFLAFLCHCSATHFIVGDSTGWVLPPYPMYYSNWSHSRLIRVGDSLEFNFDPKFYNLVQVQHSDYDHCTTLQPIKIFNSSPTIIQLKEKGNLFFTCSIGNYCCLGQKIAITVHEHIAPSPPPSQAPSSSPNGSAPHPIIPTPASSISPMPANSTTPPGGGNHKGGISPVPASSSQGEKSSAVALVYRTSTFDVSLGSLLIMFGSFLGLFWVM
ncbi:hypothetical protein RIF29_29227 [Crotalaria pallida]|uniref:Phytocyanin domain-containing protein n=1 Tax=Crotalaria pallida TaxID=3830 RepID=A0AAN9I064_CROPI